MKRTRMKTAMPPDEKHAEELHSLTSQAEK
jgi:hypothetical protein